MSGSKTDSNPLDPGRRSADGSSANGLLLMVSGPSGVGKTTIIHRIRETFQGAFITSATTRPQSDQEVDGVDYHFIDQKAFQAWIDEDRFLEYAQVFGRSWYGTPRADVDRDLRAGKLAILDIDVQGARQVRERMPGAFGIFILPPDESALLERLRRRGREDEATIERRFAEARHEISVARSSGVFDAFVTNDDLDRVVAEVVDLVSSRIERI